jgi:hypothetical protein
VHATGSLQLQSDEAKSAPERYRLTLDVRQTDTARHASGTARLEGHGKYAELDLLDVGELQVGERWASVSAMARWAGRIEPLTLILDAGLKSSSSADGRLIIDTPSRHAEWQIPSKAIRVWSLAAAAPK